MVKSLKNYPGNKNVPGLYQWIINRIPLHKKYYEPFGGSASIALRLPDIVVKVINDISPEVTALYDFTGRKDFTVTNVPAVQLLSWLLKAGGKDTFVYCDPPYKISTRGSQRKLYDFEMTDADHEIFLSVVHTAPFNCMISHYKCELYDKYLKDWNQEKRKFRTRGKTVYETIYYNYEAPKLLQSYAYVGVDCWDRQRVTRKINRLVSKLKSLPDIERNAIINRAMDPTVNSNFNAL